MRLVTIVIALSALLSADTQPPPPAAAPSTLAAPPARWGWKGHEMAGRAAVSILPASMPAFFPRAGDQLVYLIPEPDRWRDREMRAMDQAWSYDHYIDLENIPDRALDAPDRFTYLKALQSAGLREPVRDGGFLPYRIRELYERLVTEWRMWRRETDPERRAWIAARIVNDAGLLGHYVTDSSNPHHTTIHFNGWNRDAPNPRGYTYDDDFHYRFESLFVQEHVTQADVSARVGGAPAGVAGPLWPAILAHIRRVNGEVERLYRLEQEVGFDPDASPHPAARDFAADRLADGGRLLADLWWSAWLESEGDDRDDRE